MYVKDPQSQKLPRTHVSMPVQTPSSDPAIRQRNDPISRTVTKHNTMISNSAVKCQYIRQRLWTINGSLVQCISDCHFMCTWSPIRTSFCCHCRLVVVVGYRRQGCYLRCMASERGKTFMHTKPDRPDHLISLVAGNSWEICFECQQLLSLTQYKHYYCGHTK